MEETYIDLVYALAKRCKELGEMKMGELRETAGYNCDTPSEARKMNQYFSRGELSETILIEEFLGH